MKATNAPIIEEMIVDDDEDMPVSVLEYDYSLSFLWKQLRSSLPVPDNSMPVDEEALYNEINNNNNPNDNNNNNNGYYNNNDEIGQESGYYASDL